MDKLDRRFAFFVGVLFSVGLSMIFLAMYFICEILNCVSPI